MPPLPPVANVFKIQMKGKTGGKFNWANVFHVPFSGGVPSIGNCEAIASEVIASWTANWAPLCPTSTELTEVVVTDLTSNTAAEGTVTAAVLGTSSFDKIPANACHLVSKLIEARYRGGHPRTYQFIGGDGHLLDDGHWQTSAVTAFLAAWTQLILDIGSHGPYGSISPGGEVSISYYTTDYTVTPHKRIRRVTPIVYTVVADGYHGNQEIASQRRRIGRKR
jgi:hypothetical protein